MQEKTLRITNWEVNYMAKTDDIEKIKAVGKDIAELIARKKLSRYQAMQLLEYVIILIDDMPL